MLRPPTLLHEEIDELILLNSISCENSDHPESYVRVQTKCEHNAAMRPYYIATIQTSLVKIACCR